MHIFIENKRKFAVVLTALVVYGHLSETKVKLTKCYSCILHISIITSSYVIYSGYSLGLQ